MVSDGDCWSDLGSWWVVGVKTTIIDALVGIAIVFMIAAAIFAFMDARSIGPIHFSIQEAPPQIPCPLPSQHGQRLKWTHGGEFEQGL